MEKKNNIGLKIGTPLEVMWNEVKEACESRIDNFEKGLIIDKELLKLAINKILLEKRK